MIQRLFLRFGRSLGPVLGLVLLCLGMWIATPYFLTGSNLLQVVQQSSLNAIIALGMTFVILTGGIDLSVGSVLALVGVVTAYWLQNNMPVPAAIAAGLLLGTLCGLVNGFFIAWGRIAPFIVTLGMMGIARGAALIFSKGSPISGFAEGFRTLATGNVLFFSNMILLMLVLYIIAYFILRQTRFGRHAYCIGGNEHAAFLSGVQVRWCKAGVYAFSGFTAAVSAVLLTARLNSAQPTAGNMYELDAIAAAVIGGTSLMGGEGNAFGTLVGALIIGVLRNGLTLLEVDGYVQNVVVGGVIIVSAMLDAYLKSHKLAEVRE